MPFVVVNPFIDQSIRGLEVVGKSFSQPTLKFILDLLCVISCSVANCTVVLVSWVAPSGDGRFMGLSRTCFGMDIYIRDQPLILARQYNLCCIDKTFVIQCAQMVAM